MDSRDRDSQFYIKAMMELKRLEEEPLCHRIAARMLMDNCQGLEDVNEKDYIFYSGRIQRHHVESFAASLAICDMERSGMTVPDTCFPFQLQSLLHTMDSGDARLDVSQDQVGACLTGLGRDHRHLSLWISYRDSALMICRASRMDIEKGKSRLNILILVKLI